MKKDYFKKEDLMKYLSIIIIILYTIPLYADQTAIIKQSRIEVLLKDDGSWEYIKKNKPSKENYNFRQTYWGMDKKSVMSSESSKLNDESENMLVYNSFISGMECYIIYHFTDKKLVRTQYYFTHIHSNKNIYIDDYYRLKDLLVKKYKDPIDDKIYWRDDLYKNKKDDWGFAISLGDLAYLSQWNLMDTNISLFLTGDNYEINLLLEYESKILKDLDKSQNENTTMEDL